MLQTPRPLTVRRVAANLASMGKAQYHLYLTCACGHSVTLRAEDIPDDWTDPPGLNTHPSVLARMRCSVCGRRGRPQSVIISPVRTGPEVGAPYDLLSGWRPR